MKYFLGVCLILFTVVAFSGSNQGIGTGSSSGGLTNAELRASPIDVNGTFTAGPSDGLTQHQFLSGVSTVTRITNPVSVVSSNLDVALSTRLKAADTLAGITTVGAVTTITNPVAITTSSPLNVISSNLDVALSTRLKPADTLAGITTVGTITNPVAITTSSPLSVVSSNLDVALSTRLKPADTLAGITTVGALTTITNPVAITTSSPLSVVSSNLNSPLSGLLKPADTLAGITTVGTVTTITNITNPVAITASSPLNVQSTVGLKVMLVDSASADLTAAKNAQTTRAVGVIEHHDAGRTAKNYSAFFTAGTANSETVATLTASSGTSATTSGTSFTPTSGKTLRLTNALVGIRNMAATAASTMMSLRLNTAGACTASSTPILFSMRAGVVSTVFSFDKAVFGFNEGYEIVGNGTLQFCISTSTNWTTTAPQLDIILNGYEY